MHITWERPSGTTLSASWDGWTRPEPRDTAEKGSKRNRDKSLCMWALKSAQLWQNKTAQVPSRALVCGGQPERQPCGGQQASSPGLGPCPRGRTSEQRSSWWASHWYLAPPLSLLLAPSRPTTTLRASASGRHLLFFYPSWAFLINQWVSSPKQRCSLTLQLLS